MHFDNIFDKTRNFRKLTLNTDKHSSISTIDTEQFYIKPIFIDVHRKDYSKFLLFSAPGATGKSALAKYIAKKFNAIFWDLSKIRLGENSLHGTLIRSMGTKGFSEFIDIFSNGEILFVIDAFDEADMISGRIAIEHLLNDLIELSNSSASCNIVLLARTETAKFIKQHISSKNIFLSHYEIGFFGDSQRIQFVKDKIKFSGETITQSIEQCIDKLFIHISNALGSDDAVKSFLGYAPVLEAISKAIEIEKNHSKLLSNIESSTSSDNKSTKIINTILFDLIDREKNKVKSGLFERCGAKYPDFNGWDSLYNEQEQLIRMACFILFGESSYSDYPVEILSDEMKDDYTSVINTFIKDHPFLLTFSDKDNISTDFAGPAFRDYALSRAIQFSKYEFLVDEYFNANKSFSRSHFPSQLFFDFYVIFSDFTIFSHHFPYLYDSFKSKETASDKTYVTLFSDEEHGEVEFSLHNQKKEPYSISLDLKFNTKKICISQLSNAFISTSNDVIIGATDEITRISNSTIDAGKIVWGSDNIRLEAFSPDTCLIQSRKLPETKGYLTPTFEVCTDNRDNIKISLPDFSNYYRLRQYQFEFDSDDKNIDINRFVHALKAIFVFFRKHGKDAPGKHKDLINNIIIGHSKIKKSVFEFLLDKKIIYIDSREANLYKMSTEKAAELGINWIILTQGNIAGLENTYKEYLGFAK